MEKGIQSLGIERKSVCEGNGFGEFEKKDIYILEIIIIIYEN